jgi:positive regulator of sigma E activity
MEVTQMEHVEQTPFEERSLLFTAVIYYMLMLAGLVVGLYGLFSLFSLATSQVLRSQATGSIL